MSATIRIKRRTTGVAGSPAALASGEVAFNEASSDLNLYYGAGDNGSGAATSIAVIGGFGSFFTAKVTSFTLDQFGSAVAPISGVDPTLPSHLATKNYVDNAIQGLDPKSSVQYATAGSALPSYSATAQVLTASANGVLTVDGGTPAQGQRVLIKDEPTLANNGIFVVTSAGSASSVWVLTRAPDFNVWAEVPGAFTFVEQGAVNADTGWLCSADQGGTLGTTGITFVQFSSAGVISPGNGLTKSGNTLSVQPGSGISVSAGGGVQISASYAGQASITTLGTITAGTWNGGVIGAGFGGTGLTAVVNGLLKGNGSSYAAAVAGTDFLAPAGGATITTVGTIGTGTWNATAIGVTKGGTGLTAAVTGLLKGNGTAYAAAVAGTDFLAPAGGGTVTTVGTIGTGTWQGTAVGLAYGGTGGSLSAAADGTIFKKSGTALVAAVAGTDFLNANSTIDGGTF